MNYANEEGESKVEELLYQIFSTIAALTPSKNAVDYWLAINKSIMGFSKIVVDLWKVEKVAVTESVEIAKEEEIMYLASEREKIMRMNHEVALKKLIKISKIESKIQKLSQSVIMSCLILNRISKCQILTIR